MAARTARTHVQAMIGKGVLSTTRRPTRAAVLQDRLRMEGVRRRPPSAPKTGRLPASLKETPRLASLPAPRLAGHRPPKGKGTNPYPLTPLPLRNKRRNLVPRRPVPLRLRGRTVPALRAGLKRNHRTASRSRHSACTSCRPCRTTPDRNQRQPTGCTNASPAMSRDGTPPRRPVIGIVRLAGSGPAARCMNRPNRKRLGRKQQTRGPWHEQAIARSRCH